MSLSKLKSRVRRGNLSIPEALQLLMRSGASNPRLEAWLDARKQRIQRKHGTHDWLRRGIR